jgi:hypothetical protein
MIYLSLGNMRRLHIDSLHQTENYRNIFDQFLHVAKKLWKSKKAITEGFFSSHCGVLPEKLIISREIIPVNDEKALVEALREGIRKKYQLGIRTCFSPQIDKSPWVMGINTEEDIASFLDNEYPKWLEMPGITELIVMNNPSDLDRKDHEEDFFVFKMGEKSGKNFDGLYIEARLNTLQLRSLDADTPINTMLIFTFKSLEDFSVFIGGSYTKDGEPLDYIFKQNSWDEMRDDLKNIVNEKSLETIVSFLENMTYLMRDSQLSLKRKLTALDEMGLEFSEWQAKTDEDGTTDWMKIYGLKGSRDDTRWTQVKSLLSKRHSSSSK